MSTLTDSDRRYLEKLFDMGSGYVLDYSDADFDSLFKRHGIEIHGDKYKTYGSSKSNKLLGRRRRQGQRLLSKLPLSRPKHAPSTVIRWFLPVRASSPLEILSPVFTAYGLKTSIQAKLIGS